MQDDFKSRALKVGTTALVGGGLIGWALNRTNLSPTWRGVAGLGVGVIAGAIAGQKAPNLGLGLIAAGAMVGGGYGARAVVNAGLMTPTATTTTTTTTGTNTGTTSTTASTGAGSTSTGLGLGSGFRGRGLGAGAQRPRVVPMSRNQLAAAMTPHLMNGARLR